MVVSEKLSEREKICFDIRREDFLTQSIEHLASHEGAQILDDWGSPGGGVATRKVDRTGQSLDYALQGFHVLSLRPQVVRSELTSSLQIQAWT